MALEGPLGTSSEVQPQHGCPPQQLALRHFDCLKEINQKGNQSAMDKLETAAKVAFRRIHCGFDTGIDGRQQNDQNPDFKELCFSVLTHFWYHAKVTPS